MRTRTALLLVLTALVSISLIGCRSLPDTKYDEAASLKKSKKYSAAITKYNQFIAENKYPSLNPYAQYNIARCCVEMKNKPAAQAAYKKLIAQYPQSEPAQWAKRDLRDLEKMTLIPAKKKPAPRRKRPTRK